jgi:uncharacterized membrane protein YoaK (UPF0700 family)
VSGIVDASEAGVRAQWALAILLGLIAGYLDGYGLLFLGVYVSFMSGNTTVAGLRTGQASFHAALPSAIAVFSFVTAAVTIRCFKSVDRELCNWH